jgi:hypothetical protein
MQIFPGRRPDLRRRHLFDPIAIDEIQPIALGGQLERAIANELVSISGMAGLENLLAGGSPLHRSLLRHPSLPRCLLSTFWRLPPLSDQQMASCSAFCKNNITGTSHHFGKTPMSVGRLFAGICGRQSGRSGWNMPGNA